MAMVILLDQRNSSAKADLVDRESQRLNTRFTDGLALRFVRTAGDEMQAVLSDPAALAPLLADVLDSGDWWTALGVGAIVHVGDSARASSGPAFKAAREAIEAAKRDRRAPGPAVRGEPRDRAASLQAALAGWGFIRGKRTPRQREVLAAVEQAGSQRAAAAALGISQQAVSDALAAAGHGAERQLRGLISGLAARAIER